MLWAPPSAAFASRACWVVSRCGCEQQMSKTRRHFSRQGRRAAGRGMGGGAAAPEGSGSSAAAVGREASVSSPQQPKPEKGKMIKGERLGGLAATSSPWVWTVHGMDVGYVRSSPMAKAKARIIFGAKAKFLTPASLNFELPKKQLADHTEVAVIGRSNVGKSSLIAALLGATSGQGGTKLVRTSKTPGCTQTINFYTLEGQPLFLVDLPGYGFARAPESTRDKWMEVVESYLGNRPPEILRRTLLLVDSRHGLRRTDQEVMRVFDHHAVPYQVVLTKADAISNDKARQEVLEQVAMAACRQRACLPVVHLTSSKQGFGVQELREALAALVGMRRRKPRS